MSQGSETTYREAIREALRDDDRVFLMGEDVGHHDRGCYAVSRALLPARCFCGPKRIVHTPRADT